MGGADIDLARGRARALRGATLGLIIERGGHGYELTHRLNRRLGPTWQIDAKQVYPILDEFVKAGLATSTKESNPTRPRQTRTVYHATDQAPAAFIRWMQSPVEKEPLRPDIDARLASGKVGAISDLVRVLDEYEAEILRLIEANDEDEPPVRSWDTLVLAVVRDHTDAHLQAEYRWLVETRRRLGEYAEQQRGS